MIISRRVAQKLINNGDAEVEGLVAESEDMANQGIWKWVAITNHRDQRTDHYVSTIADEKKYGSTIK